MATRRTRTTGSDEREAEMIARATWLHFVGGLTQSEVARRLGIPTTRAHRYITRAQSEGLVRVFVDVQAESCLALEQALSLRFGLSRCRVAMAAPEVGPLPLRALSVLGGDLLMQLATSGEHAVIGVGNGRTLAASVDAMARCAAPGVRFVSVLGGLTRSYAANPYDVIHRLARKTEAEAYLMPAPLFANSREDKRVMLSQFGVSATMRRIEDATAVVIGVGAVGGEGGVISSTLEGAEVVAALRETGATAEALGQFLDAEGRPVSTPYDDRAMAPDLESLRGREVIAVAGGAGKETAVAAMLKSGLLTGLITDEATARFILNESGAGGARAAE